MAVHGVPIRFYVSRYGQGAVFWTLRDGSKGYIRSRGMREAELEAIVRALQPRVATAAIPGFDLTREAPLGLAMVGETGDPVRGSSAASECTMTNGTELRVVALHGDTVFRYGAAMDWLPLPQIAERDGALIEVFGPEALAPAATASVQNASTQLWTALPHRALRT